ncbi:MAG: type III-A CRISPR-associated RAMP protein Csm4 [Acidobacteria bacterium]|nr:type III-A CRISPR-associated RAMP protein Csm4 [Acidobacteriota bacterium]
MTTTCYSLGFRAPLHIGERGVGLEESRTFAPADTLFSALCTMWRELYGVPELEKLLQDFQTGTSPFLLTSAFPYAGTVRFFPRPMLSGVPGEAKVWRRVQFVSERRFRELVSGSRPALKTQHCLSEGTVWVHDDELPALQDWQQNGVHHFWQHAVTPRVTLDRITSASALWHLGGVTFAAGCGLWFGAQCRDEWQVRFATALRLLGDTGLGGERGAGYGLFSLAETATLDLPAAIAAERFVTLSPVAPANETQLAALTADTAISYHLLARRGWVGSSEAGNLRRQQVWMFGEGSLLSGTGISAGRLVNVKPTPSPHSVWRYGLAFPVGVQPCANV